MGREPGNAVEVFLNVAEVVRSTEAEGPGKRFALWFQGCPLRCPGCCNPEMLRFDGGTQVPLSEMLSQIESARDEEGIEGITLIGGEPAAHAEAAAPLAAAVRAEGLSVMVFSGFTLEELQAMPDPAVAALLAETDLLVDGRYEREHPEHTRRWIGSSNQRIHFLTDRYAEADACWETPNTLEIRLANGEVTVNGFPAQSAVGVWKRLDT